MADLVNSLKNLKKNKKDQISAAEEQIQAFIDAGHEEYLSFKKEFHDLRTSANYYFMFSDNQPLKQKRKAFYMQLPQYADKEKEAQERYNKMCKLAKNMGEKIVKIRKDLVVFPPTGISHLEITIGIHNFDPKTEKEVYKHTMNVSIKDTPNFYRFVEDNIINAAITY